MEIVSVDVDLMPGNGGKDCPGNGETLDADGNLIECCCDECDYLMCCIAEEDECSFCDDTSCPRKK